MYYILAQYCTVLDGREGDGSGAIRSGTCESALHGASIVLASSPELCPEVLLGVRAEVSYRGGPFHLECALQTGSRAPGAGCGGGYDWKDVVGTPTPTPNMS